jgi:hypothetical protein
MAKSLIELRVLQKSLNDRIEREDRLNILSKSYKKCSIYNTFLSTNLLWYLYFLSYLIKLVLFHRNLLSKLIH